MKSVWWLLVGGLSTLLGACGDSSPTQTAAGGGHELVGEQRAAVSTYTEDFESARLNATWPIQWSAQSSGASQAFSTTATFSGAGQLGRVNGPAGGSTFHYLLGAAPRIDSDQSANVAIGQTSVRLGLVARRSAPDSYYGCWVGQSVSTERLRVYKVVPGSGYQELFTVGTSPPAGVSAIATTNAWYRLRFKVTQDSSSSTRLQAKLWQGANEPSSWTIDYVDNEPLLQNSAGYNGVRGDDGSATNKFMYFDDYSLEGVPSANVCTSDGGCESGRFCSQAGECRMYSDSCSTNAQCGQGQVCQYSACICPSGASGCQVNGGPAPTLADLKAGIPSLQYRPVTFARDTTDYFLLPTQSPVTTAPTSPQLQRANHFIMNVAATQPVTLTVGASGTSAAPHALADLVAYDSSGTFIKRAIIDSALPGPFQNSIDLGSLAAGNYEFDIVPRTAGLKYTVAAPNPSITLAFKGGADLTEAGTNTYFFVPAEVEKALLIGQFDASGVPQFFGPDNNPVTPIPASPSTTTYIIDTKGKPGVWRTSFRTTSSRAHFVNLPDLFSFDPNAVIASKRIRTEMTPGSGATTAITSPNNRYNNRFSFHVASASTPVFTIGNGSSITSPPHIVVRIIDSSGADMPGSPFDINPNGTPQPASSPLQPGDYELHVTNPSIYNAYSIGVPPGIPFVSVDGYGVAYYYANARSYFTIPAGTPSVRFAAKANSVPIEIYNASGTFVGAPTLLGNNVYEISLDAATIQNGGIWAINLKNDYWSDIRLLNVPQIIAFNKDQLESVGPGGITTCTTDADCWNGMVCGHDNGHRFDRASTDDVCWPSSCGTPQMPEDSCGNIYSPCGKCDLSHCTDGVKNFGESDVDCGGECAKCVAGKQCSDGDCGIGLTCGTNNGGYFGLNRSARVCWSTATCEDGVDASECGTPDSLCGTNCGGVVACDPVNPVCPAGEVCKAGLGQSFDVDGPAVCVDPSCPSNDPNKCGTVSSLCGKQCVCTPDCSTATAANPDDHCGGVCLHLCGNGQACCTTDVNCAVDAFCQAQPTGPGICRPNTCAYKHLSPGAIPPLCGSASSPCGEQCPTCTPECDGRQCGMDTACGVSCGSCGDGQFCDGAGQCVATTPDHVITVKDGNGGTTPLPNLPQSSTTPIGALAGEFSVSEQGQAQYNIPIQVPPGRGGIEPALSLRYVSTKASGEAGIGWKLEGLSQITRCPRTYALDGYAAPIKNDTTDMFCIDGKRLEKLAGTSVAYGGDGAEYRTLIDSFNKIKSRADAGDGYQLPAWPNVAKVGPSARGPDYFEVWTKDGRKLTYGHTRDSLVMGRNGVRQAWLLNRVEDRFGNSMIVRYSNLRVEVPPQVADRVPNMVAPQAIFYTGHGTNDGDREVRFEYENRLDGQVSYGQGGVALINGVRLKRLSTYVHGDAVKSYRLRYATDSFSQLKSVAECAHDNDDQCKPGTDFEYIEESGFTNDEVDLDVPGAGQLDINGDGIPDFLITKFTVGDMPPNVALNVGLYVADVVVTVLSYVYLTPAGGVAVGAAWGFVRGQLYGFLAAKPKVTFTYDILKGNGNRLNPMTKLAGITGLPCDQGGGRPLFMDYDQDGKDDVVSVCSASSIYAGRSLGTGNFAPVGTGAVATLPQVNGSPSLPGVPFPILYDVNGDALQDIVSCTTPSRLEVRLRTSPEGGFGEPVVLEGASHPNPLNLQETVKERLPFCSDQVPTYRAFDIDGDGTPELLTHFFPDAVGILYGKVPGWYALRFSPDSGDTLAWRQVNFPDSGFSPLGEGMVLGDLNNDGLADIWRTKGNEPEATVWMNTGAGFLAKSINRPLPALAIAPPAKMTLPLIADHNADGRLDIFERWEAPDYIYNVVLQPDGLVSQVDASIPNDLLHYNPFEHGYFGGRFSTVGDVDGDGNDDLFGANAQTWYGSGVHNLLLSKITDGLGNVVHVDYDSGAYSTTCTEPRQWPERCVKRIKGLVSQHREGFLDPSGPGGEVAERSYSYTYENGRISLTGHGWLGFDRRTVTETVLDQTRKVTMDFGTPARYRPSGQVTTSDSPPYLYPLAGLPRSVVVDEQTTDPTAPGSPIENGNRSRRTRNTQSWGVKLSEDGRPFPTLLGTRTETFSRPVPGVGQTMSFDQDGDLRTSCSDTNLSFDGYGNVTHNIKSCGNPDFELSFDNLDTQTTFLINRSSWAISNPEWVTIHSQRGESSQTQVYLHEYDSKDMPYRVTRDPLAGGDKQRVTYTRDPAGFGTIEQIAEDVATAGATRTTDVTFDDDHIFPTEIKNSLGHVTKVSFESHFGQLASVADPNDVVVQYGYDAFGQRKKVVGPDGTTTVDYGALPQIALQTDAGLIYPRMQVTTEKRGTANTFGGREVTQLDNYGRAVRTIGLGLNGVNVIAERAFDARGRVASVTAPHLAASSSPTTSFTYDYLDRVTRMENSDGSSSEHYYASGISLADNRQNWIADISCPDAIVGHCAVDVELSIGTRFDDGVCDSTNPLDEACCDPVTNPTAEACKPNVTVLDHAGLVQRTIDGKFAATGTATTNFTYGAFQRLNELQDNAGASTIFQYDDYGRLKRHHDPDSGDTTYTYNGFSELVTSLDPNNRLRTFAYDPLGRLESILDPGGATTTWNYDIDDDGTRVPGKLVKTTSATGQLTKYAYEPVTSSQRRGLLSATTYVIDGTSYIVGSQYDDLARLEHVSYPTNGGGAAVRASYHYEDTSGALYKVTEDGAGPARKIWQLDQAYQGYLAAQQSFGNGATTTFDYDAQRRWLSEARTTLGGTTIQDLQYSHYGNGQVHERISPDVTQEYTYDGLGRLATLTNVGSGFSSSPHHFGYDNHGNLTQNDAVTSHFDATPPHLPHHVGSNSYAYFPNGNLLSRQGPDVPGGVQSFTYTPFDLPKEIVSGTRTTQFDYTADEERVLRRDPEGTRYSVGGLYERLTSSSGSTVEERFRIAAGGQVVAEIVRSSGSDKTLYFHPDHLGTPDTISDSTNAVIHQSYDAFGDLIGAAPGIHQDATRIGFTGQDQDNDLRLIDMGGRVYDPLGGRFTTADPMMQAPFSSQGQNRYAYVFNDPVNGTDPSGFSAKETAGVTAWAGLGAFDAALMACAYGACEGGAAGAAPATWGGVKAGGAGLGSALPASVATYGMGKLSSLTFARVHTNYSGKSAGPSAAPTSNAVKANTSGALGQNRGGAPVAEHTYAAPQVAADELRGGDFPPPSQLWPAKPDGPITLSKCPVKVGCYHHPWVAVQMRNYRREWTLARRVTWWWTMKMLHEGYAPYDYAAWNSFTWMEFRPGQWITVGDFGNYIAGYGAGYGPPDPVGKEAALWGDYAAGGKYNKETDTGGILGDSQRSTYFINLGFGDGYVDSFKPYYVPLTE